MKYCAIANLCSTQTRSEILVASSITGSTGLWLRVAYSLVQLCAGPTSFAPLIYAAISVVENSNWQYHVLVIIADGQVTCS
jgi:hypothetical protein